MAIEIQFNNQRARQLVECLTSGKPVPPASGDWTSDDLLALAGACYFLITGQGPADMGEAERGDEDAEADAWNRFSEETHAAIEWVGDRTMDVMIGEYDEQFEATHTATIEIADDEMHVTPTSGFKKTDDEE